MPATEPRHARPSGRHAAPVTAGRHRAPKRTLGDSLSDGLTTIVAPVAGMSGPVLGGVAAGTLGVAASVVMPGIASGASAEHDIPGTHSPLPGAVTVAVQIPAGASFAAPSSTDLSRLRQCESTGNYAIATGNGFYGAYQFDLSTWRSLGLDGSPQQAAPALQDAAASALEQSRGWEPWPACSSHLGLVPRRAHGLPVTEVLAVLRPTVAGAPVVAAKGAAATAAAGASATAAVATATAYSTTPPPFAGHVLSIADSHTYRSDVRAWQQRMALRGWNLTADGYFGANSQRVARAFAAEKGISDGLPGEVGAAVWAAAWSAPLD